MSEFTESLTKQLEQEVEEHNNLAKQIEEAHQNLFVRKGGILKLQEIIARESSKELKVENPDPEVDSELDS